MKKIFLFFVAFVLLVGLCACQTETREGFTVKIVCQSADVASIYYSYYIGNERLGMGGVADLDGKVISSKTPLEIIFLKAALEGNDLQDFGIEFSPYRQGEAYEMGHTNRLHFAPEFGKVYTIVLSGNVDQGFTEELQESVELQK